MRDSRMNETPLSRQRQTKSPTYYTDNAHIYSEDRGWKTAIKNIIKRLSEKKAERKTRPSLATIVVRRKSASHTDLIVTFPEIPCQANLSSIKRFKTRRMTSEEIGRASCRE